MRNSVPAQAVEEADGEVCWGACMIEGINELPSTCTHSVGPCNHRLNEKGDSIKTKSVHSKGTQNNRVTMNALMIE